VSLPKGGGALRSIGEKFAANPVTGTASFTVPIAVSPGRSGFQPALTLSYDSGAGNGPYGVGWSLTIPAVTRKTDKGLPRYVDEDTFVLAGAEDLVPALIEYDGASIADERTQDGYTVRRYRPRVEGAFARIERWTDRSTGESHWTSVGRDNVTSVFGRSAQARLADPDDPRRVFQWFLEESSDERGNIILYEYKAEDLAEVDFSQPFERPRALDGSRCTQLYPKRITYGNRRPFVAGDWLFELVCDYGEHDDGVDEARPWPVRQDPFSRFRAGFDQRTYRLCRRILMFHHFTELGDEPCLVRSTDFQYQESRTATLLASVTVTGYRRDGDSYSSKSLPPVEFGYSQPVIGDELGTVAGVENLPAGLDQDYEWIDLNGDGAAGVLARSDGAWFYKRNLGGGTLGPLEPVGDVPSLASRAEGYRLMDLGGDGRLDLVCLGPSPAGYQERTAEGDWAPFLPFRSVPNLDWADENLRFLDLDGDGLADVLITEDELLCWYPSLGKDGFGEATWVRKPTDEERGPALLFQDRSQAIFLADMTGDGLTDLVRVRNGSICYWPSRGYARFGAKVSLSSAPWFDTPDRFDSRRVRLADVDGTGPADVLYLDRDGARVWFNQAGNSFGPATELTGFPGVDSVVSVDILDLLGDGTACLVWSSPSPGPAPRLRYLSLMAEGKPYLLTSITNNLGAETALVYAPSTKFYLEDRAAGRPWITLLPFPVQVLEQVELRDRVTGRKFSSRYAYHHGYFDGDEREFRGFGLVEQWDTEEFDDFDDGEATNANAALYVPPVHTRTWFHTGAWKGVEAISRQFRGEYYGSEAELPDTTLPAGLSAREAREACRALKGRVLRSEVYSDDGSDQAATPYTVTETNYQLRRIQPFGANIHAVFAAFPAESLSFHYERNPDDPRVLHEFTLRVDDYGNVTRSASVGYPHRTPAYDEQAVTSVTVTEASFVNQVERVDAYHLGVPYEQRTWELTGLAGSFETAFSAAAIDQAFDGAPEIPFEEEAGGASAQRRLIAHERTYYYADDLSSSLALGELGNRVLIYERERLVMTHGLIAAYGGRVTDAMLIDEGGYVASDGGWWARSGRHVPDAALFYQPSRALDPFGNETHVSHDDYALLVDEVVDPLGNTVTAAIDYRVLQPYETTDPNGNRTAVSFDELGLVTASAVMGKEGVGEGDTLDDPTRRLEYELSAWRDRGEPAFVHVFAREQHGAANPRWQESYEYYDGIGRVVMTKVQAESGPAPKRDAAGELMFDAAGNLVMEETASRWVGTGRTVVDNKGNPVKQYEPFFSSTSDYEDESELVEWGVTPILHYDPLSRNIETELPNGTLRRVKFDPWRQETWDENDTVLESAWYAERAGLPSTDPGGRAAALAAGHAESPTVTHLDGLGRPFLTVQDNRSAGNYETRVELDIQGNQTAVIDGRGLRTREQSFTLTGTAIHRLSPDAGETWTLTDVTGKPARVWRSDDLNLRHAYDALRRPTHLYATEGSSAERLVERTVYGESHANPAPLNLRGAPYMQLDGAGLVTLTEYDFKGNLLNSTRRLMADGTATADWSSAAFGTAAEIAAAAEPRLDAEVFTARSTYDALNRRATHTTPDGSVTRVSFNEASLLESIEVNARGAAAATTIVTSVSYNARGQRERIEYGNGATTAYEYDPETFRLTRLTTTRAAADAVLQELSYGYDPVGNITEIGDDAQQTLFFANTVVAPDARYEYDAIYRLVCAEGREHANGVQVGVTDREYGSIPHPNDAVAVVNYTEEYSYDAVGNILSMTHHAGTGGWTRFYEYASDSNRLLSTSEPGDPTGGPYTATYSYDGRGSMTAMPHLASIGRDFRDQITSVDLGGGGTGYYNYDTGNQRVRKLVQRLGAVTEECIYLGAYEVYRKRRGDVLEEERQTVHVMDDKRRILMIETATVVGSAAVPSPTERLRYQLDNHLGSACLEIDGAAAIISYEEYHPYGTTSYHSEAGAEISRKRYRYTGKEKDEETGLNYHGARYLAPWLGRWCAVDPAGLLDGVNGWVYARNNPINGIDAAGLATDETEHEPDLSHLSVDEARRFLEDAGGFIIDDAAPSSWPRADGYKVFHGWAPESEYARWYRLHDSGAVESTSWWDEHKTSLIGKPGGLFAIAAVELLRGGPSVMAEEATIAIAVGGIGKLGVGGHSWMKSVTNFDDIADAAMMGAQEGAAEAVEMMNPFTAARASATGPLRPPARALLENEGLLITGTPAAGALESRIAGRFRDVQLGQHGDAAAKYLYTVDERGVNLVRELTPFPTPRLNVVHSNISSEASIGGEAWFGPNNSVTINAGSGRFGDAAGISQQQWDATVRLWESLGYKVNAVPFGKR
jgi:RHS repeat-associated protein